MADNHHAVAIARTARSRQKPSSSRVVSDVAVSQKVRRALRGRAVLPTKNISVDTDAVVSGARNADPRSVAAVLSARSRTLQDTVRHLSACLPLRVFVPFETLLLPPADRRQRRHPSRSPPPPPTTASLPPPPTTASLPPSSSSSHDHSHLSVETWRSWRYGDVGGGLSELRTTVAATLIEECLQAWIVHVEVAVVDSEPRILLTYRFARLPQYLPVPPLCSTATALSECRSLHELCAAMSETCGHLFGYLAAWVPNMCLPRAWRDAALLPRPTPRDVLFATEYGTALPLYSFLPDDVLSGAQPLWPPNVSWTGRHAAARGPPRLAQRRRWRHDGGTDCGDGLRFELVKADGSASGVVDAVVYGQRHETPNCPPPLTSGAPNRPAAWLAPFVLPWGVNAAVAATILAAAAAATAVTSDDNGANASASKRKTRKKKVATVKTAKAPRKKAAAKADAAKKTRRKRKRSQVDDSDGAQSQGRKRRRRGDADSNGDDDDVDSLSAQMWSEMQRDNDAWQSLVESTQNYTKPQKPGIMLAMPASASAAAAGATVRSRAGVTPTVPKTVWYGHEQDDDDDDEEEEQEVDDGNMGVADAVSDA